MTDSAHPEQPVKETDLESIRLRDTLENTLDSGEMHPAIQAARQLMALDSSVRQWSWLRRTIDRRAVKLTGLKPVKVAILSSFTLDFIHDSLIGQGFLNGLRITIQQSGFNQFRQEILNPSSELYAGKPDVVILAVEGGQWMPALYDGYLDLLREEGDVQKVVDAGLNDVMALVERFREQSDAAILVHDAMPHCQPALGVLDGHVGLGQGMAVGRFNGGLLKRMRSVPGAHVVAYARLVSRFGVEQWLDPRMAYYAQAPIRRDRLHHLAAEYMAFLRAMQGMTRKCVVLDLDNTLWGGIIGEDGLDGIKLGPNYPGSAFVAFQKAVLQLHARGIVLAIASKNNPPDVDEVFQQHDHMVLKKEHFAAQEIHWKPKSQSLRNIAHSLNLGLEHMVFVDDNPAECEQVRSELPMVTVIQVPKQPELAVHALMKDGWFDGLSFSEEDRKRNAMYKQRAGAESLKAESGSLEEYYRSLEMTVHVAAVNSTSLARTVQLTQKTNQLNLTTRRYSETDVTERMHDDAWVLITVQVKDRFGDNGIVGVVMACEREEGVLEVDTFLLSCRVIGRTIETALLALLCDEAEQRGVQRIEGEILPTRKNVPARAIYQDHGFTCLSGDLESESRWGLNLQEKRVECPDWLQIVES
ncbi:MAG: HAD family hydrolase [Magnetococcales bacterium]|nr:HAD family hydrolase [Magnetococcales bacterium]